MHKFIFNGALDKVSDLIENRLTLLLSENNLNNTSVSFPASSLVRTRMMFKKEKIIKNIDNSIIIFNQDDKSVKMAVMTRTKKGNKIEFYPFGVVFKTVTHDTFEMYLDNIKQAYKRGILPKEIENKIYKISLIIFNIILINITIGLSLLLMLAYPIFIPLVLFYIFFWIPYDGRKIFEKKQSIMNSIMAIFEKEFPLIDKTDTKDRISYFGRIKTDVEEIIKP